MSGWSAADGLKVSFTYALFVAAAPSVKVNSESTVLRFAVPNGVNVTPSLENETPMLEVPENVRPPKLIDQLLPITGTEPRSAAKTTVDCAVAIIASDSVEICPSEDRVA